MSQLPHLPCALSSTPRKGYNHVPTFASGTVTKIKEITYRKYFRLPGEKHSTRGIIKVKCLEMADESQQANKEPKHHPPQGKGELATGSRGELEWELHRRDANTLLPPS